VTLNAQYQYQDIGGLDATNATPAQIQNLTSVPGSTLSSYGTGAIGFQVSVPILAGGGIDAKVRQAIDNYEASQQQQSSVTRKTDQEVRNSYWQVQNGVSLVEAQKAALVSSKTKLDSDQLGYQVGIRNSVDLVSAQKDYYKTFQTFQQSRYQYLLAEVQLQYLSGKIDEQFMQQINANIKN
jgi:outer membrane protein